MKKKRQPPRTRSICKKCGIKFSYTPWRKGTTRDTCNDCQPNYGAA